MLAIRDPTNLIVGNPPMRLAWLTADATTWALVRTALAGREHVLVWASEAGAWSETARALAPTARWDEPWENLLGENAFDLLLVGRDPTHDDSAIAERLGRLQRVGVPMAVTFPPLFDVLAAYELEMVRQEQGGILVPLVPAWNDSAVERLVADVSAAEKGALGRIEQCIAEHGLYEPTRGAVQSAFARDMLLVRRCVGELTRVAALVPPGEQVRYQALGVQLSGPGGALVRWSVAGKQSMPGLRLTFVGTRAQAHLELPSDGPATLRFDASRDTPVAPEGGALQDAEAQATLSELAAIVTGRSPSPTGQSLSWQQSIRGLELAEALDRSLKRGKTIELAVEEPDETGNFKALMSAAGCLLLLAAPVAIVTALGLARIKPLGPIVRFVPWMLAGLLVLFLGLQLFRLVLPPRSKS